MPYISQTDRKKYALNLEDLFCELAKQGEEDLGGHLNYCVSYLMNRLFEDKERYVRVNTIRGAIENAMTEFYRCQVTEYEDKKRRENGEV